MLKIPISNALIILIAIVGITIATPCFAQQPPTTPPPGSELRLYDIVQAANAERIERDIRKLVGFGTRHTLSDTVSDTRGIGAAR